MTESPFSHVEDIKPATTPDNASVAVADMFSASTVETPEVVDPIVNDSPNFEQPVEEVKVEEVVVEETVAEVDESLKPMRTVPALTALLLVLIAVMVTESNAFVVTKLLVKTAVADSPKVIESVAESIVRVFATTAADDGTTESIPKPNAATATSAMRLMVVVVDICFLSISRSREFPSFGFEVNFLTSVR